MNIVLRILAKFIIFVLLFFSAMATASNQEAIGKGFQVFFANMRSCLESTDYQNCLPNLVSPIVKQAGPNYSRSEFIKIIASNENQRLNLNSCFYIRSKVVISSKNSVLFRSGSYACNAIRKDGNWYLNQFYNFYSQE